MKLYELLSKVSFDGLVPTLNTLVIKENQLPYFKMAFDELRMKGKLTIHRYLFKDSLNNCKSSAFRNKVPPPINHTTTTSNFNIYHDISHCPVNWHNC